MASRKIFGLFLSCELFSVSCSLRLQIYELQYSPKIMHAQEVLALQENASREKRVKLRFIRKKFKTQEDQNPIRKKLRLLLQAATNRN